MNIQKEDILAVAKTINFEPTDEEIQEVINRFESEAKEDSGATWDLVIEKILYDLKETREHGVSEKQILVDAVLEQIKKDIYEGDLTALEELLKFCPDENLIGYLPE